MALVEPVRLEDASPEAARVLEGASKLLGRTPRSFAVMCHTPQVARWMLAFVAAIHRDGTGSVLDGRIKNLATLKTASLMGSTYSLGHNRAYGQEFGMDDERFEALQGDYRRADCFDDRDKAVLAWTEAVTQNTAQRDSKAFEDLRRHFTDAEIVELTMVICHFNGMNRFTASLQLELEAPEEVERIRATRNLPAAEIEAYVRRVSEAFGGSA